MILNLNHAIVFFRRHLSKIPGWLPTVLAITAAMILSAHLRMEWVHSANQNQQYNWQGNLLPTTQDTYLFASIIDQGSKPDKDNADPIIKNLPEPQAYGPITLLGTMLVKATGITVWDYLLYAPIYGAGLIAIPVVLIGRLYGSTLAGFCAACLTVSGASYFNRSMAGYLDTDVFAVTIPTFILYTLLRTIKLKSGLSLFWGTFLTFVYPFFYSQGTIISTLLVVIFLAFKVIRFALHRRSQTQKDIKLLLASITTLCAAAALSEQTSGLYPTNGFFQSLLLWLFLPFVAMLLLWIHNSQHQKVLVILKVSALVSIAAFLLLNSAPQKFVVQLANYYPEFRDIPLIGNVFLGPAESNYPTSSLHYKNVYDTIIEAGGTPWGDLMVRISGSPLAFILFLIGYIFLIIAWPEFLVGLPLIALGIFAHWGGHRFTIYAVPIAALSVSLLPISVGLVAARLSKNIGPRAEGSPHNEITLEELCTKRVYIIFNIIACMSLLALFCFGPKEQGGLFDFLNCMYIFIGSALACVAFVHFWNPQWLSSLQSHASDLVKLPCFVIGIPIVLLCIESLIPNVRLAYERSKFLPTVLSNHEAELLHELKIASRPGDYVHSWWDWGTAIWLHSERNVLTTPNNQSNDTFIFAKMMITDSPRLAAHLGRASVEYYHHGTRDQPNALAVDHLIGFKDSTPTESLTHLAEFCPVEPTRDVFLFLPSKLISFYHVLHLFSERDLLSGTEAPLPLIHQFVRCEKSGDHVFLGTTSNQVDCILNLSNLLVTELGKRVSLSQIRRFSIQGRRVSFNSELVSVSTAQGELMHASSISQSNGFFHLSLLNGKTRKLPSSDLQWVAPAFQLSSADDLDFGKSFHSKQKNSNDGLHLIYSEKSSFSLLVDSRSYNSQLIQLLVLGKSNSDYFELVASNSGGKVYKLKK